MVCCVHHSTGEQIISETSMKAGRAIMKRLNRVWRTWMCSSRCNDKLN